MRRTAGEARNHIHKYSSRLQHDIKDVMKALTLEERAAITAAHNLSLESESEPSLISITYEKAFYIQLRNTRG